MNGVEKIIYEGVEVTLARNEDTGHLIVHVNTEAVAAEDLAPDGEPLIELTLNDHTFYDKEVEESEFGSGLVVCLAKFSEHLSGRWYERIGDLVRWHKMSPEAREREEREAALFPSGDAARRLAHCRTTSTESPEQQISMWIEMWMNGASDHFYQLDRERSPDSLNALADLALQIGHGFSGTLWSNETVTKIRELWKQACLDVDAMIGVKADWGQW